MKLKHFLIGIGIVASAAIAAALLFPTITKGDELLGSGLPGAKWFVIDKFDGYQTKADGTKVSDGANPQGQNTIINDGDRLSIRDFGYDLFPAGTASTTVNPVLSLYTFKKRDGTNILLRNDGSMLRWFDQTTSTWEILETGFTPGKEFGFADFNINTDLQSYVYFGNSEESSRRWNGAVTNINGAVTGGDGLVVVDSTTGFDNAPGYIIYCGQRQVYLTKTATQFNLDSGSNSVTCSDNEGVAQAPTSTSDVPRGNLFMVANNRLFVSGVTSTPQAIYFSGYGNASNFGVTTSTIVTDGTAESAGVFNLAEGGGRVVGMTQDENALYFFKQSIVYRATLTDALYTLTALKSFDGTSQSTGAVSSKSIFAGGNGIFFITPDNQIMNITRVENFDSPQIVPISDPIKPTTNAAVFTSSTGIFWRDKAYIAAKTNSDSTVNDVIFVYNFRKQAWESPVTGWNVWTWAIYDDGDGKDLYFGHARTADSYVVSAIPLDDIFGVTANWRSKQFDFGLPYGQKEIENVFLEGYIADNTTLSISLLLDEDGYTQTYTTNFKGTETGFLFNSPVFNLFGLTQFGTQRFGTNDDASGKKKFRVYLNKNFKRAPFYNAQIEFASDGENYQWEITRFGMEVREHDQPLNKNLFRAW